MSTEVIQNGSIELSVKIYSGNKTETIILLHGGPGVPDDMIDVVNILKDRYRIITFDQRGTGLSKGEKCSFTMDDYISDIDCISKKLGIEEFHFFGHSWGGLYAQIYAEAQPTKLRSLFLCSPSSGTNEAWQKTEKEVMQFNKNRASTGEWLKMGWYSLVGMLGSDNGYRKMFRLVLINYNKKYANVSITEEFLAKIFSPPINKTRKEIVKYKALSKMINPTFPVMITYGDDDVYGESKKMLIERYPTAKLEIIEKCGHLAWLHNLDFFEKILCKFYKI